LQQIRRLVQAKIDIRHLVLDLPRDCALERELLVDVDADAVSHEASFFLNSKGAMTAASAHASSTAAIGRVTKIRPLPCDRVSDWRSEFSKIGPSTRPRIIGAADQSCR